MPVKYHKYGDTATHSLTDGTLVMTLNSSSDRPPLKASTGVAVVLLFGIIGALYSVLVLGNELRYPDEKDYLTLARNLGEMQQYTLDGTHPTALRPPGYPVFLAPLTLAGDALERLTGAAITVHLARAANFILLGLSCLALGSLLPRDVQFTGVQRTAIMVAGLVAYPVLIYTAGTLFAQTLILALLSLVVWLLQRGGNSLLVSVVIGICLAWVAQVSPTALFAIPACLGFALLTSAWSTSRVMVMVLAAALVFSGWFARNLIVMQQPVLFSTNLAYNLDNAVLGTAPLEPDTTREPKSAQAVGLERLLQFMAEPQRYADSLASFFVHSNELQVSNEQSSARDAVMFITYYTLLALVLLRLVLQRLRPLSQAEWLTLALYLGTALLHALVFSRVRYRLPFDFLLLLPATTALVVLWQKRGLSVKRSSGV